MIDVGDVYSTSVTVRDSAGDPADAGAVFCTVIAPDGVVSSLHVLRESPGLYRAGLVATQPGIWQVRWTATGINESAHDETFNVRDPAGIPVVSLADVREHLNITTRDSDDELRRHIDVASYAGTKLTGRVFGRRTQVDTLDGGQSGLALSLRPVLTVTSVTEHGVAVPSTGWRMSSRDGGVIERVNGYDPISWRPGSGNIVVTYIAGYTSQPATDVQGTLEMVRHLWQTQRGVLRRSQDDGYSVAFSVPNRVAELWSLDQIPSV